MEALGAVPEKERLLLSAQRQGCKEYLPFVTVNFTFRFPVIKTHLELSMKIASAPYLLSREILFSRPIIKHSSVRSKPVSFFYDITADCRKKIKIKLGDVAEKEEFLREKLKSGILNQLFMKFVCILEAGSCLLKE